MVRAGSVLLLVVFACAGRSIRDDGAGDSGDDDTGGSAGTSGGLGGGATTGGSGGTATTGGFGATVATGGTPATGGTTATGGRGGTAGICTLEPEPGPCEGAFLSYAYDVETGLCLPFYYGGCEGNPNRFETSEECYQMCEGARAGGAAYCETSLDCAPISTGCCSCSAASIVTVVGVNRANLGIVGATKCATVDCDPCTVDPAFAWFGASCRENHCVAWDSRNADLTACTSASECRLRLGLGCCEGCFGGADALVAVNASREKAWLCPDLPEPCPVCPGGPAYPGFAFAACANGRCALYLE